MHNQNTQGQTVDEARIQNKMAELKASLIRRKKKHKLPEAEYRQMALDAIVVEDANRQQAKAA